MLALQPSHLKKQVLLAVLLVLLAVELHITRSVYNYLSQFSPVPVQSGSQIV